MHGRGLSLERVPSVDWGVGRSHFGSRVRPRVGPISLLVPKRHHRELQLSAHMPSGKKGVKKGLSSGPNGPIPYSETVLTEQPSEVGHHTNVVHEPASGNAVASMVGGNSDIVGALQSSNMQENIPEMYDMSSDKESQHDEPLVTPNSQSPVYGSSSVDGSITTVSEHGVDTNSQYSSWSIPPGKNFAKAPGSVASEGNTDSFEFLSSQASVGFGGHSSSDGSSVGPDCKDPALMVDNVLSDLSLIHI